MALGDNVHYEWMDQIRDDNEPLVEVIESAMHANSFNLGAFLCFMGVRLLEMKRVLKETGRFTCTAIPRRATTSRRAWTPCLVVPNVPRRRGDEPIRFVCLGYTL